MIEKPLRLTCRGFLFEILKTIIMAVFIISFRFGQVSSIIGNAEHIHDNHSKRASVDMAGFLDFFLKIN